MKIVFLSHSPDMGTLRVGSHHLARELAHRGHAVFHLSTPLTAAHVARVVQRDSVTLRRVGLLRRPRRGDSGELHGVAWQVLPEGIIGRAWLKGRGRHRQAIRLLASHGFGAPDVILVDQPTMTGLALSLSARALIYRPTDSHFDGVPARHEAVLVAAADAIVATSQTVLDRLPGAAEKPSLVLENGVEHGRFARGARVGRGFRYVGAIDHRFDWRTVHRLAAALPGEQFHLAGPVTTSLETPPPNVRYIGPIPYQAAPGFLAAGHVGLLPLTDAPINDGRSPMKFFEYLAAELHVLGTRSPALASRAAPGVWLYESADEASRLAQQLAGAGLNTAGGAYAKAYDWPARASLLDAFVAEQLA